MNIPGKLRSLRDKFYQRIEALITKYHRIYLGIVCLFALLGYFFVLLFPLMVIVSANNIINILTADTTIDWQAISVWSFVLVIAALISYRSITIKSTPAVGLTMPEAKVPKIYELVRQVQSHFKRPSIQRIIVTANYELDIVKTPRWILPVWSKNTLVIGLPVLLCLTPKQFECMLARRIGQFSKQNNMLTNWLYQLRGIWKQYCYSYGKQPYLDSKIMQWLYAAYAALYDRVSVYAARTDEMKADKYAMELYTHDDVREMITVDSVCRWYLQYRYWPAIKKIAISNTSSPLTPFRKLSPSIRGILKEEKLKPLLAKVFSVKPDWQDPIPSLKVRLDSIGHDSAHMSENKGVTAAEEFLGTSLNGTINLLDKLWLKNNRAN